MEQKGKKTHPEMNIIALLVATASAFDLTSDQIQKWNQLQENSSAVTDNLCAGEILESLKASNAMLTKNGLTPAFITQLSSLAKVSGDIEEAAEFRASLANITSTYTALLDKLVLEKNITDTAAAAKVKAEADAAYAAAGVDAGQAIYGILY
jgi:hypothetical protein